MSEPWGHGTDGVVPQIIGVSVKFRDVCGFLLILSHPEPHLSIVSFLNPFGDNLEASADRNEGVDVSVIVFKTFRSIQIDCPFCLCEALSEVFNEALLACHCDLQLSDVVVGLLLLVTEIIDEAIDDLSWCRCIVRMGSQGRESGAG